ncbi:hypothetical protein D3C73_1289450 [compost metagenome]
MCQFHHGDSAGHGFNGAGASSHHLIQLLTGRLDTVSIADDFQCQFEARRERCAKGGDPFLLGVVGNGGKRIDNIAPLFAVDRARHCPRDNHGPGHRQIRFMRRAGCQRHIINEGIKIVCG